MKARLFVVNEETFRKTQSDMVASIYVPNPYKSDGTVRKLWFKTVIDIIADMLQIQVGDYIFFWETKSNYKSRFFGVYRAISKPYYEYQYNDNCIFKVRIEVAYYFTNPIDEYDILNDPYIKSPLWTIIGKKVAGKSRGSTPLSTNEMNFLIQKLIDKNKNYTFYNMSKIEKKPLNYLAVDLSKNNDNIIPKTLADFDVNKLSHTSNNGRTLRYEKSFEAILNQMIGNNDSSLNQLDINVSKISWYANYLPYSIEQSEIDYLIIESDDGFVNTKINVIEFMLGTLDVDHISRCLIYSKWVNETIANGANIANPIIICGNSPELLFETEQNTQLFNYILDEEKRTNSRKLEVYKYNIIDGEISFIKVR